MSPSKKKKKHSHLLNRHLIKNTDTTDTYDNNEIHRIPQDKDGNCLFHCVGYFLNIKASSIRSQIIKYVESFDPNERIFEDKISDWLQWVVDDRCAKTTLNSRTVYIEDISKDGVWGGAFEMLLISRLFNCHIDVYELENERYCRKYEFHCPCTSSVLINLLYIDDFHYDVLVFNSDLHKDTSPGCNRNNLNDRDRMSTSTLHDCDNSIDWMNDDNSTLGSNNRQFSRLIPNNYKNNETNNNNINININNNNKNINKNESNFSSVKYENYTKKRNHEETSLQESSDHGKEIKKIGPLYKKEDIKYGIYQGRRKREWTQEDLKVVLEGVKRGLYKRNLERDGPATYNFSNFKVLFEEKNLVPRSNEQIKDRLFKIQSKSKTPLDEEILNLLRNHEQVCFR
jgi:hypothetical protein